MKDSIATAINVAANGVTPTGGGGSVINPPNNPGSGISPPSGPSGPTGPPVKINGLYVNGNTVYQALRSKGLTDAQARGIIGNIMHEDPTFYIEQSNPDAHNTWSKGLIQWNTSGPWGGQYLANLVTGNPSKDFNTQIDDIVAIVRRFGINGTTAAEVAGQWAAQVEGCQGCQPGQGEWAGRIATAEGLAYQYIQPPPPVNKALSTGSGNIPAWERKGSGVYWNGKKWVIPQLSAAQQAALNGVTNVANRTRVTRPKPKPLGGSKAKWQSVVNAVINPFKKAARRKAAPRRPNYIGTKGVLR